MSVRKHNRAKHTRVSHILTKRPLELLHMDLMGPSKSESLGGKKYILVVVDDFSRYTWVDLLREKSEAAEIIQVLCRRLMNEKDLNNSRIRTDHGREF